MRNLKRTLSLALSSVMLTGLMTVGAGAVPEFSDKTDIENGEAVDTLVAINIINGKDDGSFDPDGIVTREEMAKMITVALNGGKDPVLGTNPEPSYSDIDGTWAEAYIEYCTRLGIIAGKGDGTFGPKDPVTGEAAAKMMLVAMGWEADIFHFEGSNWAMNVAVEANKARLYDEIGHIQPDEGLSRDDAAQLIYNGILSDTMIKEPSQSVTDGEVTWDYRMGGDSIFKEEFDGLAVYGYLTDFEYDEAQETWDYDFESAPNFGGKGIKVDGIGGYNSDDDDYGEATLTSAQDYTSLLGQRVRIVYEDDDDTLFGAYAHESSVVATGVTGQIGDYDDDSDTIEVDGEEYDMAVNGDEMKNDVTGEPDRMFMADGTAADPDADDDEEDGYISLEALEGVDTPVYYEMIDNTDDGKIDAVIVTPFEIAELIYATDDKIILSNGRGTFDDMDEIVIYDDYEEDDYVAFLKGDYSNIEKDTFVKMDLDEGEVEAERTDNDNKEDDEWRIDGDWYKLGDHNDDEHMTVGNEIEYVLLGSRLFHVNVVEHGTYSDDIAAVVALEKDSGSFGKVQAKLMFTDGTTEVVDIAEVNGATSDDGIVDERVVGTLVTYTIDDEEYELTSIDDVDNKAGYDEYEDEPGTFDEDEINGQELADDAIVFVMENGYKGQKSEFTSNEVDIYTGKEIKNSSVTDGNFNGSACLVDEVDGFRYAQVAIIVSDDPDNRMIDVNDTAGDNYGYLTAKPYKTEDYLNFELWTEDGSIDVQWDSNDSVAAYPEGTIISYNVVDDDEIDDVKIEHTILGAVTGWDGDNKIQIENIGGGTNEADEVDPYDTVVLYINSDDKEGVDSGEIQQADDTDEIEGDNPNVRYLDGKDGTYIHLLVVDVTNEMDFDTNEVKLGDYKVGNDTLSGTLIVDGTLTLEGVYDVNGTLRANQISGTGSLDIGATGTVSIGERASEAIVTNLEAITAKGATVVLNTNTETVAADKWYSSAGEQGTDGEAIGADRTLPAGTYKYVKDGIYANSTETEPSLSGWVRQ